MANVGMKLSPSGTDVLSGAHVDMRLTSKYPVYKVYISNEDTATILNGNQGVLRAINHTLTAATLILVYAEYDHTQTKRLIVPGRNPFVAAMSSEVFVYAGPFDSGAGLNVQWDNGLPVGADQSYDFLYYIMHDQLAF